MKSTPQEIVESKIAPWRNAMIAGYVHVNGENIRPVAPTAENMTVKAGEGGIVFLIDGVPAAGMVLSRAYEYALIGLKALIESHAERMIKGYMQAIEDDHINDMASWIHTEEHWEYERDTGFEALEAIGYSEQEIAVFVQECRDNLSEDYADGE